MSLKILIDAETVNSLTNLLDRHPILGSIFIIMAIAFGLAHVGLKALKLLFPS